MDWVVYSLEKGLETSLKVLGNEDFSDSKEDFVDIVVGDSSESDEGSDRDSNLDLDLDQPSQADPTEWIEVARKTDFRTQSAVFHC